jgi:hypothetical protein
MRVAVLRDTTTNAVSRCLSKSSSITVLRDAGHFVPV